MAQKTPGPLHVSGEHGAGAGALLLVTVDARLIELSCRTSVN